MWSINVILRLLKVVVVVVVVVVILIVIFIVIVIIIVVVGVGVVFMSNPTTVLRLCYVVLWLGL